MNLAGARPAFWKRAACVGHPLDIFFPEVEADWAYEKAKEICAGCPVKQECEEANASEPFGCFFGTTPTERLLLKERAS